MAIEVHESHEKCAAHNCAKCAERQAGFAKTVQEIFAEYPPGLKIGSPALLALALQKMSITPRGYSKIHAEFQEWLREQNGKRVIIHKGRNGGVEWNRGYVIEDATRTTDDMMSEYKTLIDQKTLAQKIADKIGTKWAIGE